MLRFRKRKQILVVRVNMDERYSLSFLHVELLPALPGLHVELYDLTI